MLVRRVLAMIASATKVPAEQISLDSTFAELGIYSLQRLNLLFEMEIKFHLTIPNPGSRTFGLCGPWWKFSNNGWKKVASIWPKRSEAFFELGMM
jgi:hypothetical protein